MKEQYQATLAWLQQYPELHTLISLCLLLLGAWIANWVVKRILVRGLYRALRSTSIGQDKVLGDSHVVRRLANIVPALILTAADDPFVPASPFHDPAVTGNPRLHVQVTDAGGHCAFLERASDGYDGYWVEREIVRFITAQLPAAPATDRDIASAASRTPDLSLPLRA